ncbi:hypothetical protein [Robertkochia sediminum]|uniref:hypothetical protein n=1 Tax=Robertkochia sediminum TaxID=2785326 RepID=UPI00193235FE|nr:hypothetical protein [Robertkochia sediminum]MBL7472572.1 hypothetical protein [Robertkochia sediminum]
MPKHIHLLTIVILFTAQVQSQNTGSYQGMDKGLSSFITLTDSTFHMSTIIDDHGGYISSGKIRVKNDTLILEHEPQTFPQPYFTTAPLNTKGIALAIDIHDLNNRRSYKGDVYLIHKGKTIKHLQGTSGIILVKELPEIWEELVVDDLYAASPLTITKAALPELPVHLKIYLPKEDSNSYNTRFWSERFLIRKDSLIAPGDDRRFYVKMPPR